MKIPSRKILRIALQVLGVALFAVILSRIDIASVGRSFANIGKYHLAATVLILVSFTLVKSMRWRTIVSMQGENIPVQRAFSVYSAALYLGFLTPGRIGDFFKSVYLAGRGMPAGKAVYSSIVDRLFDLVFLAVIGFISLLTLPGIFENQLLLSGMILISVASVSCVLFWRRDLLKRIAARFLASAPEGSLRGNLDKAISDAIGEFETLTPRGVSAVIVMSGIAWILHYGVFVLLADGLGTGASLHVLIVSVSAAIFTALIPVSLSGLGTRDVVLILVFGKVGLSNEAAVTFSLSFILVYVIQGLIGLVCWLVAPIGREKEKGRP